ncbi:MAG: oligosaccharide flippase family protein, partial [Deltaproteobacteria bacterium]|nr:oligosaccharide flippase family protein [Deltaproteobacteria bacterium]
MKPSKRIFLDALQSSLSSYVYYSFKIFSSLFIRKILSPLAMGHVSSIFLVVEYAKLSHLGMLYATEREIPYQRGKGDLDKVSHVMQVSFNFNFFTAVLMSVLVAVGAGILTIFGVQSDFLQGLYCVPFLLIAYMFVSYFRIVLKARHEFGLVSQINLLDAVSEVGLTLILVIVLGVKGIILALAFTFVIGALYLNYRAHISPRINFGVLNYIEIKRLLKIGFPLMIDAAVRMFFLTSDKILIIVLLGQTQLGLYSMATMVFNFLMPLPRAVYNVLAPRFYEAYGQMGDFKTVKRYLTIPTTIFAHLFSIVIGAAAIFSQPFIYYFLPLYQKSIT